MIADLENKRSMTNGSGNGSANGHAAGVTEDEIVRPAPKVDLTTGSIDHKPAKRSRKRAFILGAAIVGALAIGTVGTRWVRWASAHESTDDAFVEGHVVPISTKSAGYVQAVAVEDNQHVQKGDLLVQIDPRDYQAKLDQERAFKALAEHKVIESRTTLDALRANVEAAKSELAAAQANLDYAKAEAERFAQMGADASSWQERHTSETQRAAQSANVQTAKSKIVAAEAQLANGESQLKTAQAGIAIAETRVHQAELDLSYTKIVAAQSGRVSRKSVEGGAYVAVGQSLLAVVPDDVWVVANFKETQLRDMRPGQKVDVKVDAYPGRKFEGHVDSIQSGTGARFSLLPPENATGNYVKVVQRVPVKIVFDGQLPSELTFAPGMSVEPEVTVK